MTDTIQRFSKSKGYESLPRDLLQNNKLSLASRGLLVNIASYPPNWVLRKEEVVHRFKESHSAVRKLWDELVENNYIIQFYKRTGRRYEYSYFYDIKPFTSEEISEMFQLKYGEGYELYHKEILKIKDKSQLNIMDFIYIEDNQKDILKPFISAYGFEPLKSGVPRNVVKSTLSEPLDLGVSKAEANRLTNKEINYDDDDDYLYNAKQKNQLKAKQGTTMPKIDSILKQTDELLKQAGVTQRDRRAIKLELDKLPHLHNLRLIREQAKWCESKAQTNSISNYARYFIEGLKMRYTVDSETEQADKWDDIQIPIYDIYQDA